MDWSGTMEQITPGQGLWAQGQPDNHKGQSTRQEVDTEFCVTVRKSAPSGEPK